MLLHAEPQALVRSWIDGVALHLARPTGDSRYFRSAKAALRALHRANICHNDLAKEQNWLRGRDGRAYLTDFQLSIVFRRRGRLFRLAAYEDLRHLLKHKRRYLPGHLTNTERKVLARKAWFTSLWMASGKIIYLLVTRGIFGFVDREGGGRRLVHDVPAIAAALKSHPQVRDVAVVAYPDRRLGSGLYAFVEVRAAVPEQALRDIVTKTRAWRRLRPPEFFQTVDALPRGPSGSVRTEILQLVVMNQIESIDSLIAGERERTVVEKIVAGRRNLRDRYSL